MNSIQWQYIRLTLTLVKHPEVSACSCYLSNNIVKLYMAKSCAPSRNLLHWFYASFYC